MSMENDQGGMIMSGKLTRKMGNTGFETVYNMLYWLVIEFMVFWAFRYLLLTISDHDIFDYDNSFNRVLYIGFIAVSLWWLKKNMSIEGFSKIGSNFKRKYTAEQVKRIQENDEAYHTGQYKRNKKKQTTRVGAEEEEQ